MAYVRRSDVSGLHESSMDNVVCLLCGRAPSDPKFLYCLHTFCAACLRQRAGDTGISCPTCQEQTKLSAAGVAALPTDFLADNFKMLERLRRGQQAITCDTCGEDERATHRCVDCQIFLCELHSMGHRKARKTSDHDLQTAVDMCQQAANMPITAASDLAVVRRPLTCHVRGHEDKQLELFCADCCQLVCRDCIIVEHREHKYSFVRDAGKGQRQQVADSLKIVTETSARMGENKRAVHSRQEELSKCVEELTDKIRQTANMHRKRIDQREEALLERLGELCRPKARILEDQSYRLAKLEKSLNHCADVMSKILELGNDEELLITRTWLLHRGMSVTQAASKESNYPLDDGMLTFTANRVCLHAIDKLGVVATKPCAWTSQIATPSAIFAGQPIRFSAILRNSLGESYPAPAFNRSPLDGLQITARHGGYRFLKCTSRCGACLESGECMIITDLRDSCGQGGYSVEFTVTLSGRHLIGSPTIIQILNPPWTIDPTQTIPDRRVVGDVLTVSDSNLACCIGVPKSKQLNDSVTLSRESQLQAGLDTGFLHMMANKPLEASNPANCFIWRVRFKKPNANTENPANFTSGFVRGVPCYWAVGVMVEGYLQQYLQEQNHMPIRTLSSYRKTCSRLNDDTTSFSMTEQMVQTSVKRDLPLSSLNMRGYCHVRSDGSHSSHSFSKYGNTVQAVCSFEHEDMGGRTPQRPEDMTWSSEDMLQLQLVNTGRLVITNLMTNKTTIINGVQLPCRPMFSVLIEDARSYSEMTVEFPPCQ